MEREPEGEAVNELACPECTAGKHGPRYCAGWTLNATDDYVPCECGCTYDQDQEDQA